MHPRETLDYFFAKATDGLRRCKDDRGLIRLLDELYAEIDRLIASIIESQQVSLACKAGCSYCCYLKVDAHAHELLYLVHHLRQTSSSHIDTVSKRAKARLEELRGMTALDALTSNRACPLLDDGRCSVYSARPLFCRTFHAQRVETCKFSFDHPDDLQAPDSQHALLRLHSAAAVLGISQAFSQLGYDRSVYDLGAAISEALDNPKAAKRWRNKIRAFSRRSYARDYNEGA